MDQKLVLNQISQTDHSRNLADLEKHFPTKKERYKLMTVSLINQSSEKPGKDCCSNGLQVPISS